MMPEKRAPEAVADDQPAAKRAKAESGQAAPQVQLPDLSSNNMEARDNEGETRSTVASATSPQQDQSFYTIDSEDNIKPVKAEVVKEETKSASPSPVMPVIKEEPVTSEKEKHAGATTSTVPTTKESTTAENTATVNSVKQEPDQQSITEGKEGNSSSKPVSITRTCADDPKLQAHPRLLAGAKKRDALLVTKSDAEIEALVEAEGGNFCELAIEQHHVGTLMGVGGQNLAKIRNSCGCSSLQVDQETRADFGFSLIQVQDGANKSGVVRTLKILKLFIEDALKKDELRAKDIKAEIIVPQQYVGGIIGKQGGVVEQLKLQYTVDINIDQSTKAMGFSKVVIFGAEDASIQQAKADVEGRLAKMVEQTQAKGSNLLSELLGSGDINSLLQNIAEKANSEKGSVPSSPVVPAGSGDLLAALLANAEGKGPTPVGSPQGTASSSYRDIFGSSDFGLHAGKSRSMKGSYYGSGGYSSYKDHGGYHHKGSAKGASSMGMGNYLQKGHHPLSQKPPNCRSIILKNVPYAAQEHELRNLFDASGPISNVHKLCREGRFTGIVFIEFEHSESTDRAVRLNQSMFQGRQLSIDYCSEAQEAKGQATKIQKQQQPLNLIQDLLNQHGGGSSGSRSMSNYNGGYNNGTRNNNAYGRQNSAYGSRGGNNAYGTMSNTMQQQNNSLEAILNASQNNTAVLNNINLNSILNSSNNILLKNQSPFDLSNPANQDELLQKLATGSAFSEASTAASSAAFGSSLSNDNNFADQVLRKLNQTSGNNSGGCTMGNDDLTQLLGGLGGGNNMNSSTMNQSNDAFLMDLLGDNGGKNKGDSGNQGNLDLNWLL